MPIIGNLKPSKSGGWEGTLQTLTINTKLRLVPNDDQSGERAPAFRVLVGNSEIGAAWKARSQGEDPKDYLSVKLDDPNLSEPIFAALFESEDGQHATLVWNRQRPP